MNVYIVREKYDKSTLFIYTWTYYLLITKRLNRKPNKQPFRVRTTKRPRL